MDEVAPRALPRLRQSSQQVKNVRQEVSKDSKKLDGASEKAKELTHGISDPSTAHRYTLRGPTLSRHI